MEMKKPDTDFGFITEWAKKAGMSAKKQGRNDAAKLWEDCLEHLLYLNNLSSWQPIETVPKDGTVIDLMHKDGGRVTDEWWTDDCFTCLLDTDDFTHWMPIPGGI